MLPTCGHRPNGRAPTRAERLHPGRTAGEAYELLRWLRERDADCMVISGDDRPLDLATTAIPLPLPPASASTEPERVGVGNVSVYELLAPIPYIVPGQLFAHYLALERGLDPDHPRGLSKVTRTHLPEVARSLRAKRQFVSSPAACVEPW